MSRTIDLLNKAIAQKQGWYSMALTGATTPAERRRRNSRVQITWLLSFVFFAVFIAMAGLNLKLYSMVRSYAAEKDSTLLKLNTIEELIKRDNKETNGSLEALKAGIQGNNKKIAALEKDADAQALAIENLTKANWNRNEAAKILGINRTTLYKKMQQFHLLKNNNNRAS